MTRQPPPPPPLLPDETQENQAVRRNRRGALVMLWLLVILLSLVIIGGAVILVYRPDTLGLELAEDMEATRVVLRQAEADLAATANAVATAQQINNDAAFQNENTLAALENRADQVAQQATQAAADIIATETGVAIQNAQRGTQNALDFENTQVAFNRQATQAELEYQGTQAALSRDATAAVLGFATQAPSGQDVLSQTPPPTVTSVPLFVDGFGTGVGSALWQFGSVSDWSLNDDGELEAARNGAWLLTQLSTLLNYRFEAQLRPIPGAAADYYLLLNVPDAVTANGLALRLSYNGERVTAIGLYDFQREQLLDDVGLLDANLNAIETRQLLDDGPAGEVLMARVEVRGNQLVAVLNETLLLDIALESSPNPGAVGVQVPVGTGVERVTVSN